MEKLAASGDSGRPRENGMSHEPFEVLVISEYGGPPVGVIAVAAGLRLGNLAALRDASQQRCDRFLLGDVCRDESAVKHAWAALSGIEDPDILTEEDNDAADC
jgi:hypothetical protein